jgi:hypothetical protein
VNSLTRDCTRRGIDPRRNVDREYRTGRPVETGNRCCLPISGGALSTGSQDAVYSNSGSSEERIPAAIVENRIRDDREIPAVKQWVVRGTFGHEHSADFSAPSA